MSIFFKSLLLLLKYRILMWANIPKRRGRRKQSKWFFVLMLVIIGVSFGVPGYFLMKSLFREYHQVVLTGGLTLSDIFLEISLMGVMMLVLLIDTPAVVLNVFMSDDVPYLLTLPLPPSSIFYFKLLITLIEGTFPALFFIPVFLAYANTSQMPWYAIAFSFGLYVFYVLFCAGIAGFISLMVAKFASKSGMKRFMFFSSTLTLVLAYLMMNITAMPTFTPQNFQHVINAYVSKLNFALWPSTWFLQGIKGNIVFALTLVGFSVAIFLISFLISRKTLLAGISNVKSSTASLTKRRIHSKSYKLKRVFQSLIWKEMKMLKREPSVLFMVVYPAVFPLIFILPNTSDPKELVVGELMGVFMASTYLIISMASLVSIDVKAEWILKSLPVKRSSLLWSKALTVTAIYTFVLAVTFAGISIFFGGLKYALVILALSIPPFLISAFFGAYAATKWPNPTGGTRKPLNISGSLISTLIGFISAGCVAAESVYFYTKGNVGELTGIFSFLLLLILPISIEVAFTIFMIRKIKKLDWGDPFENGNSY